MKKSILIAVVFVFIAVSLWTLKERWKNDLIRQGMRKASYEDFSWSYTLLRQSGTNDQLREHLKARVYYNAQYLPDDMLRRIPDIDFGPINEEMLGNFTAAPPHADSPNDYYKAILERVKK
jgi:hypothetical protein